MFFKYWKTSLHMNAKNMYIYIYTQKCVHNKIDAFTCIYGKVCICTYVKMCL